jgi:uncharacterized protein YcbK (DUF882 family)
MERPRIDLLVVDEKGQRAREVIGVLQVDNEAVAIPQVREGKTQVAVEPPVKKLSVQGRRWRWWGQPFGDLPNTTNPKDTTGPVEHTIHLAKLRDAFHAGSAFLLPACIDPANRNDSASHPLAVLACVFGYLRDHPTAGLYLAGHACNETDGSDADDLAARRAELVMAYFKGDRETFSRTALERHVDSDWKAVLRWLTSWGCDPGESTAQKVARQALDAREHFRTLYTAQTGVKIEAGAQNEGDFLAYFDLYDRYVADLLAITRDELESLRSAIVWASTEVFVCGDRFNDEPDVLDEPTCAKQRGIDFWIFNPPALLQQAAPTGVEIYDPGLDAFEILDSRSDPSGTGPDPLEESDARERIVNRLIVLSTQKVADKAVTRLTEAFIRRVTAAPESLGGFKEALDQAVAAVTTHQRSGESAGRDAAAVSINEEVDALLIAMERLFIVDPQMSTLHLLDDGDVDAYLNFAWHRLDFPGRGKGEAAGPNEAKASAMTTKMNALRPQRRPNTGSTVLCTKAEFTGSERIAKAVAAAIKQVPDNPKSGQKLHESAVTAFVAMRSAAQADGVVLNILSSARSLQKAEANAENAGNSKAVASWSSHTMGLAIDLQLSDLNHTFSEITTRPFSEVVKMRSSSVHKWMFIHGDTYGFFPYGDEPWHWEYNPIGFREVYRRGF